MAKPNLKEIEQREYKNALAKKFQLGQLYAESSPENAMDIARSISPGGSMTALGKGDVSSFNKQARRRAEIQAAQAIDYFRGTGLYNAPEYAYNKGLVHMSDGAYLSKQVKQLAAELLDSQARDAAWENGGRQEWYDFTTRQSSVANKLAEMEAQGRNYYDTDDLEESDILWFDSVINGNERWKPNYGNAADVERYNALVDQWASVEDWENFDLAKHLGIAEPKEYSSKTGTIQANLDVVTDELKRRQELEALKADIRNNPNYATLSVYGGHKHVEGTIADRFDFDHYYDQQYFMNNPVLPEGFSSRTSQDLIDHYLQFGYDYLTPEELADYNALINAGRTDDAKKYLDLLSNELLARRSNVMNSERTVRAEHLGYGALDSAKTLFENPIGSIKTIAGGLFGIDDPNHPIYDTTRGVGTTRSVYGQTLGELAPSAKLFDQNVLTMGYNVLMSVGDMTVAKGIGGGIAKATGKGTNFAKNAMQFIMSSESAASTIMNDLERGWDAEQAFLHGVTNGLIEAWTERGFMDSLFSEGGSFLSRVLKSGMAEGLEEIESGGLQVLSDALFAKMTGNPSEVEEVYNAFAATMGEVDAAKNTFLYYANQLAADGLSGLASGGLMQTGVSISQGAQTRNLGKNVTKDGDLEAVLRIADSYADNADVSTPAKKIRDKQAKGFKVSNRDVGELVTAVSSAIGEKNSKAVTDVLDETIEERLVELGENAENARVLAPAIRNVYQGKKLTTAERSSLKWSDAASQALMEMTSVTPEDNINHTGFNLREHADLRIWGAEREGEREVRRFTEALTTKSSTTTAVGKAHDKAKNLMKGKHKMATRDVMAETSDGEITGTFDHVEKKNGEFSLIMKGTDGKKVTAGIDAIKNGGDEGLLTILNYAREGSRHDMSAEEVNTMVNTYLHEGGDVDSFVYQYEESYLAGYSGIEAPASKLSKGIAAIAYEHGKAESVMDEANRVARAQKARKVETPSVGWLGDVTSDAQIKGLGDTVGIDTAMESMTDTQHGMVEFGKQLAKSAKINVVFFASKAGADGKFATQNGSYDPNTHTIYLDINSGASTESGRQELIKSGTLGAAIGRVAGHELTHVLEATSPEYYGKYKQAVKEALKARNLDYAALVREKINTALANGEKLTYYGAEAEVIADASEYMLQDSKFVKNMDQGLKGKVKEIVQNFLNKVNAAFRVLTGGHIESRVLRSMQDGVAHYEKQLQDLWDMAFDEMLGAEVRSNTMTEAEEFSDVNTQFSIRKEAPPKKTGIAYKVFFEKDGKLYPPMVANPGGADTPVGVWLNADIGASAPPSKTGRPQVQAGGKGTNASKMSLAFRPGWHLGDIPKATQFDRLNRATGVKELFPYNFVWAECEYAMDVDYQEEAMSYGYNANGKFQHSLAGLPRLPVDGYYHYRTNPNPNTVPWVITGAMKVNRVLSRQEVDDILREKGVEPTKWQGPNGEQMEVGGGEKIQYAIRDGLITTESTEQERYNILKDVVLKLARVNTGRLEDVDLDAYNTRKKSSVEKGIRALANKLGITNVDLENSYIDFPFQFTNKNLGKSLHHQLDYGGTYQDYVKAMSCFDELVENAIPIETHPDKKLGTVKGNTDLKQVYVLVSAFKDSNRVVPVQFEIKEYRGNNGKLYMMVALTKITPEVVEAPGVRNAKVPAPLFSGDIISLRYLFENVNSSDYKFFKYVPDGFLNDDQRAAKARALSDQAEEYASYGKGDDSSPDGIEIDDDTESAYPTQKSIRTWAESDYDESRVPIESIQPQKQFSLRSSVEKRDDGLMAMHNLKLDDMWGTIKLGGFPMPSIAIVKAKHGHTMYGPYSVIFGRKTIDPEEDYRNRVYGADAWTPVFPQVETELLGDAMYDVQDEIATLAAQVDDEFKHRANTFFGYFSGDDSTHYTMDDMLHKAWNNYGMLGAYMIQRGEKVNILERDVEVDRGFYPSRADVYDAILDVIGNDLIDMPMHQILDVYGEQLALIKRPFARMIANWKDGDRQAGARMAEIIKQAIAYEGSGRDNSVQVTKKKDYYDTENALKTSIDREDFNAWMSKKIERFFGEQGVYNGKDRFTPSGNRRTFKQTHMPLTAENVVKSMLTQQESNIPATDAHGLMAAAASRYNSVDEIRADSDRLGKISDEEYRARLADADNDLRSFLNAIEAWDYDQQEEVGDLLVQAAKGKMSAARIKTLFAKHGYAISVDASKMATRLLDKVQSIPTGYFEAKPARVVSFDEVRMVVTPQDMPTELAAKLDELGIPYTTYDGTDADRLNKANAVENVQFSLRDTPDGISIRDYLSGMEPTKNMTETEKLLLKRYKENLQTIAEKQKLVDEQDAILSKGGSADDLIKAKNRKKIYIDQLTRAERALRDAESSEGFANIMATSQNIIWNYLTGTTGSIADAADALDDEIKGLSEQLVKINAAVQRSAEGQRIAFAHGLFKHSDLNAAAKALKANYGSRMSEKAIADRLALAFSEIYSSSDADGARRFAEATRSLAEDILRGNKYRYKSEILPMLANNIGTITLSETDMKEIKNAGISISEYKRMLSPYIKVSVSGDTLSSHASNAEYYGIGALSAVLGDDTEGNLAMRLYNTISAEKAKESDNGFDGMDEGTLLGMIMGDIASSNIPLTSDNRTISYLRNELLKQAGESEAAARAIDAAIAKAKATTAKASSVWREAVKAQTTAHSAVKYYRALDEQRRLLELKEQKETITSQLRSEHTKELAERLQKQKKEFFLRRDLNIEIGKRTRHIKRIVKKLDDRIRHEEDYKNVKEPLKPVVHKLVQTFIDGFGSMVFDQTTADRLRSVYEEIAKEDAAPEFYSDDVANWLSELSDMKEWDAMLRAEGSSSLGAAEEKLVAYTRVAEIADHIYKLVTAADEIFISGKRESFAAISGEVGDGLTAAKDKPLLVGAARTAARMADELLRTGNMTPTYFFQHLKNSGLSKLFGNMMDGQRKYSQAILDGRNAVADAKRRYNFYAWQNMKNGVEFRTEQGHLISLTVPQMMWVYATAKREATNKLMDTHHLDQGGFRYEEKDLPKQKGKMTAIPGSDRLHLLSKADVEMITNTLTAEQKACADELVSYLSNECAEQGNRASMELFGIKKYNEEYYFPFKTASDQRYQRSDAGSTSTTNDARVKHTSFTHSLRKGANTPLVMGDFFDVIADHINQMATYSSFVVPIESMNRVLNAKVNEEADGSGSEVTVRSLLARKFGEPAQRYVADLMKDLNGGPQTDNRGTINALFRAFKRGAVMGSLSVALQQPTAIARAFAYVNPKYFTHITMEGNKKTWERMLKYSGTAVIKDMGKFDVGTGKTADDWIANSDLQEFNVWKRGKFLLHADGWKAAKDNWVEWFTALPGVMDRITWTHIWKAIEAEQADLNPGMDRNSEEFLTAVGKRFDDVINHTQVYDSILAKSQNMRSKNAFAQMSTAFMSEPTLNANMLYDAARGSHSAGERAAIVTSVTTSSILAAAMASLIAAWNKDDDDRKLSEKYLSEFASRAIDSVNPLTMIPYVSDVWSMLNGYDIERTDLSVVKDVIDYTTSFISKAFDPEKANSWRDYETFFGTIANLTGIPAKNVSRDIRRIRNLIVTDKSASSRAGIKYTLLENITPLGLYADSNKAYCQRLVASVVEGDKQEAYDLWDYLTNSKKASQNSINTNIRDELKRLVKAGDITPAKAAEILRKYAPYVNDKDNVSKPQEWLKDK